MKGWSIQSVSKHQSPFWNKMQNKIRNFAGTPQPTARPTYRRAITSFRIVEIGTPWYASMRLDELNRTILGRPGFDNSERSYSSAVGWARGRLACSQILLTFYT